MESFAVRHWRVALTVAVAVILFPNMLSAAQDYLEAREPRFLALVIGNYDYKNIGPLKSARKDTDKMAAVLGEIGFGEVLVKRNLRDFLAFNDALVEFRFTTKLQSF